MLLALLVVTLSACGKDAQPLPTATSEATPVVATVGMLADRIASGWKTIDRYRSVTTIAVPGTPGVAGTGTDVIEEVILPDQRRQVVTANGVLQSEIVAAGGTIYGRGPDLPGMTQPNRNPDVWITITGAVLGPDNAFSEFYRSLLLPSQAPYAGLSDEQRKRPVEMLGTVEIAGTVCQQYRIVDTTLTGERVVIVLSLADDGLVCSIETTSEASVSTSVYSYDQPDVIALPASPVPAPLENG